MRSLNYRIEAAQAAMDAYAQAKGTPDEPWETVLRDLLTDLRWWCWNEVGDDGHGFAGALGMSALHYAAERIELDLSVGEET
jgi:hypothetical protein